MSIKVGINGFGVIGRRVAYAVNKQEDMELIGIGKTSPDYKAKIGIEKGFNFYVPEDSHKEKFNKTGLKVSGSIDELIEKVDIIVDATPGSLGEMYREKYLNAKTPALFQGGESKDLAEVSFVAQCNYENSTGKNIVRVVSCNTTGLSRVLGSIDNVHDISKATSVIARRAVDPDLPKGLVDSVSLDPVSVPSHHGPDVSTILPNLDIVTMAIKIPTTHNHVHSLIIDLNSSTTPDAIIDTLKNTPRVMLVSSKEGIKSTAHTFDLGRELGRDRGDIYESMIWEDSITVIGNRVYMYMAVAQEAIVLPENVDAIRAVLNTATREESIKKTNDSLCIGGPTS
jgi:glyceraldehyde-3-phosphate dehydrogenase (NAD(P))